MAQTSLHTVMFLALKDNWKPILFETGTHNNIHICNVSYRENLTPKVVPLETFHTFFRKY